jgi:transposase
METKRVARRKHSAELRAEVVDACRQPGASVAAIAQRNGLNANVVHRWLSQDGRVDSAAGAGGRGCGRVAAVAARPPVEFMALQIPPPVPVPDIRLELRRGTAQVTVSWPLQAAGECGAWLREWLR